MEQLLRLTNVEDLLPLFLATSHFFVFMTLSLVLLRYFFRVKHRAKIKCYPQLLLVFLIWIYTAYVLIIADPMVALSKQSLIIINVLYGFYWLHQSLEGQLSFFIERRRLRRSRLDRQENKV